MTTPNTQIVGAPPALPESVHLMGICGTGMGALAGMFYESGCRVTGSDQAVYPPMSDFLKELGINVHQGYSPSNLDLKPDLVVVGNVIKRDNPCHGDSRKNHRQLYDCLDIVQKRA
jgi:UDP-N-acetylmuramate: L-alanyl-gamma-D-glutamyl-meso-diaminopimelate ligase